MAYFPASCDYKCKGCSQNKCGWCAFYDRPAIGDTNTSETINPYSYSATITNDIKEK